MSYKEYNGRVQDQVALYGQKDVARRADLRFISLGSPWSGPAHRWPAPVHDMRRGL